jgi:UDP-N-acetylglucosamine--N-acetylmuramyl-(pentapeptide) pyrophosphoryl-undecaprenol N-acetylglucosamine transferase
VGLAAKVSRVFVDHSVAAMASGIAGANRSNYHVKNVVPGRANRLLFKIASKIAVSFRETERYLGPDARKAVFTGNPIRASLVARGRDGSMEKFGLRRDRFTVLVMGGSQGAHTLNEKFIQAVSGMDDKAKAALQVIHITGARDYGPAVEEYEKMGVGHRVYSFMDEIEDAYNASDLVVTRSGASATSKRNEAGASTAGRT